MAHPGTNGFHCKQWCFLGLLICVHACGPALWRYQLICFAIWSILTQLAISVVLVYNQVVFHACPRGGSLGCRGRGVDESLQCFGPQAGATTVTLPWIWKSAEGSKMEPIGPEPQMYTNVVFSGATVPCLGKGSRHGGKRDLLMEKLVRWPYDERFAQDQD